MGLAVGIDNTSANYAAETVTEVVGVAATASLRKIVKAATRFGNTAVTRTTHKPASGITLRVAVRGYSRVCHQDHRFVGSIIG